jgi:ATP-dependent DNA helicase RecQ
MTHTAQSVLEHVFGYSAFRGPQQAIVDTLIGGRDALVIMPTGGGKSLCYQVPAIVRPGCGLVISPLIALMQDQVDALQAAGVKAGFLNSSLSAEQANATERALLNGELDLLYVAPERLIQPRCLNLLKRSRIALFAIDEAHCVSQWGHDFRSDYLQLSLLHEQFPDVPRIALTATADARTRMEIANRLNLQNARHFISGFDRPNIQYRIQQKDKPLEQLLHFLQTEQQGNAGVVYCLSRSKVERTAEWLCEKGYNALPYHAGLSAELRATHQRRFLREDNIIMVATIAFGMGIDKPDVRFVAHLDLPKSIEAYYQETGRAGRDGEPATALLLYGLEDVVKLGQMLAQSEGNEQHKRNERQRLDTMLGLCEITSCRRQTLLRYFGEQADNPCGNCDTCLNPPKTWDGTDAVRKLLSCIYRTGQRFGANHVIDVLRGSGSEKILQLNHHQLSTHGIGKELTVVEWKSVVRQLVARGYLEVDGDGFGTLRLSERCRPLLRGDETIQLRKDVAPSAAKAAKTPHNDIDAADMPLWHALRACRKQLAEEFGVPPYVVFHDSTLREMVAERPTTESALLRISGVGDSKLEKFGAAFLQVIKEFEYELQ